MVELLKVHILDFYNFTRLEATSPLPPLWKPWCFVVLLLSASSRHKKNITVANVA